ncbi:hypothetical protein JAAARDRAFT_53861 [Jaapia argillacea MUCL 33604]|uniref:Cation efflux protein n=1 Tax=Jaapia argillacea MUCL 33604 TaxID=933084 RepID=A0A067Q9N2_9AGAM|nr:hypothetical protein JAAARDRAFT_53861 [Jaapia argillacea MUCL 33604]
MAKPSLSMSRSARITLLLIIDVIFFFVELIVGYAVGSLALVADSFHMLNDVLSLVVALYAIKLTAKTETDARYSYGWHRAEILAALVNGVFLLALCFSIFLEAIERFFSTPEITNPKLVVVVGSLGLASNLVGLFLFHDHSHGHDHDHGKAVASKPPSISSQTSQTATERPSSPPGPARTTSTPKMTIQTRTRNRSRSSSYSSLYGHPAATRASFVQAAADINLARSPSPALTRGRRTTSRSASRHTTGDSTLEHPSYNVEESSGEESEASDVTPRNSQPTSATETTPLLREDSPAGVTVIPGSRESSPHEHKHAQKDHGHGGHGHSHSGSMNMRALVLHVLGDALGNVGVIATGLIIWLTTWSFKYYFDPIISLVITAIIFHSALPLVQSTAFILLQGVPSNVSLEDVRSSILSVEGVLSVHELHIWQLSESKVVASVHVTASRKHDFMRVAAKIREVLHHHGVHSSTIQPEYHHPANAPPEEHLMTAGESSCLIKCPPDQACDPSDACCPPPPADV